MIELKQFIYFNQILQSKMNLSNELIYVHSWIVFILFHFIPI